MKTPASLLSRLREGFEIRFGLKRHVLELEAERNFRMLEMAGELLLVAGMRGIGVLAGGLLFATSGLGQITIAHFDQIDKNVYAGSKPHSDEDFEYLQSLHVRYIVNARFWPFLSCAESKKAKRYGMTLLSFEMNGSPIPPSKKHVDRILRTLRDPRYQPVYLHCVLGRDRTGLLEGLYRMDYLGVSREEAWQGMLHSGFHTWWFVRGLRIYFDRH